MVNVTVIAESTPGPIAINCATFVGYKQAKFWGAVAATLGVILPSFILIYIISMFFNNLLAFPIVTNAFRGIKIGVGVLIFRVGLGMVQKMKPKPLPRLIAICAFAAMLVINFFALKISTIVLLLLAGGLSLGIFLGKGGKKA
jgi:chromate transporter